MADSPTSKFAESIKSLYDNKNVLISSEKLQGFLERFDPALTPDELDVLRSDLIADKDQKSLINLHKLVDSIADKIDMNGNGDFQLMELQVTSKDQQNHELRSTNEKLQSLLKKMSLELQRLQKSSATLAVPGSVPLILCEGGAQQVQLQTSLKKISKLESKNLQLESEIKRLEEALARSQAPNKVARQLASSSDALAQVASLTEKVAELETQILQLPLYEASGVKTPEKRPKGAKALGVDPEARSKEARQHLLRIQRELKTSAQLLSENAKLKDALGRKKAYNVAQGKPMSECMGLLLKALMDDPKYQCTSASQAWAFFEPGSELVHKLELPSSPKRSSEEVTRSRFRDKVSELGVLTSSEILDTVDFLDSGCSGSVNYDEWKAGVMLALAANGDLNALLTEEEFNAIMFRIKTKIDAKGKTIEEVFQAIDLDGNASLSTEEFAQGIIEFGVSQKEAKQIFSVIDADKSGTLELNEFIDAIREGSEADVMKQVAQPILRQVGTALIKKSTVEECKELATPVGSDMLSFDGFVKLVRYGHPEMALSTIMRLWCIVDKTGQGGGVGFANIPDLVTNILAATMSLDDEK